MIRNFTERKAYRRFTAKETSLLMKEFRQNPIAERKTKEHLSRKLGVSTHDIHAWFKRRREYVHRLKAQIKWKGK